MTVGHDFSFSISVKRFSFISRMYTTATRAKLRRLTGLMLHHAHFRGQMMSWVELMRELCFETIFFWGHTHKIPLSKKGIKMCSLAIAITILLFRYSASLYCTYLHTVIYGLQRYYYRFFDNYFWRQDDDDWWARQRAYLHRCKWFAIYAPHTTRWHDAEFITAYEPLHTSAMSRYFWLVRSEHN